MKNKWIYTGIIYVIALAFFGIALVGTEKNSWQHWTFIGLAIATLIIYHYRRNQYIKKNRIHVSKN